MIPYNVSQYSRRRQNIFKIIDHWNTKYEYSMLETLSNELKVILDQHNMVSFSNGKCLLITHKWSSTNGALNKLSEFRLESFLVLFLDSFLAWLALVMLICYYNKVYLSSLFHNFPKYYTEQTTSFSQAIPIINK